MKIFKIAIITLIVSAVTFSCNSGSESEAAFTEVVEMNDSLQTMNSALKDSLQMVMAMNQELMTSMDSTADSNVVATVAANDVTLKAHQASVEKFDAMIAEFEAFEAEQLTAEANVEGADARIEEIKNQQKEAIDQINALMSELENIQNSTTELMIETPATTENSIEVNS